MSGSYGKPAPKGFPVKCVLEAKRPSGSIVPPGVSPVECSKCHRRCLAAKSTRDHIAEGLCHVICEECAPKDYIHAMTHEQASELASWKDMGRN